jgi:hypothetical protein
VTVLKSRQVATVGSDLDVRMAHAKAIAAAKAAIPQHYQNNPGAVLLAQEWAAARGVDLLTTMQTVAFISGKPVIDATMQRALAVRAGYEVSVVDVSDKAATVIVGKGDKELGRTTFTMQDAAAAGLTGKDNWKKNPKAMLVARATSQAMRWFAPDVMVGVYDLDEVESDAVTVLAPEPTDLVEDVVDAEVVEPDVRSVVAGLDEDTAADLKEWWKAQGFPGIDELDAEQTQAVLDWVARRG